MAADADCGPDREIAQSIRTTSPFADDTHSADAWRRGLHRPKPRHPSGRSPGTLQGRFRAMAGPTDKAKGKTKQAAGQAKAAGHSAKGKAKGAAGKARGAAKK